MRLTLFGAFLPTRLSQPLNRHPYHHLLQRKNQRQYRFLDRPTNRLGCPHTLPLILHQRHDRRFQRHLRHHHARKTTTVIRQKEVYAYNQMTVSFTVGVMLPTTAQVNAIKTKYRKIAQTEHRIRPPNQLPIQRARPPKYQRVRQHRIQLSRRRQNRRKYRRPNPPDNQHTFPQFRRRESQHLNRSPRLHHNRQIRFAPLESIVAGRALATSVMLPTTTAPIIVVVNRTVIVSSIVGKIQSRLFV